MKSIYCGNCGFKNTLPRNFCIGCGNKLDTEDSKNSGDFLTKETAINDKYKQLRQRVLKLFQSNGDFLAKCKNGYIHFQRDLESSFILIDLGNLYDLSNEVEISIQQIGFENSNGTFVNYIDIENKNKKDVINDILSKVDYVFENLFHMNSSEELKFENLVLKSNFPTIPSHNSLQTAHSKAQFERPSKKLIIFLLFCIFVIIGYCNKNSASKNTANALTEVVVNSSFDQSVYQVEEYLKNNYLKDPDSYQGISWSKVVIEPSSTYKYIVRHKYRAKNGFGGYTVENKIFYLDSAGNVIDVKDFDSLN